MHSEADGFQNCCDKYDAETYQKISPQDMSNLKDIYLTAICDRDLQELLAQPQENPVASLH